MPRTKNRTEMKAKLQNFIIYSNVAYKIISATVIAIIKFSFKPDQQISN